MWFSNISPTFHFISFYNFTTFPLSNFLVWESYDWYFHMSVWKCLSTPQTWTRTSSSQSKTWKLFSLPLQLPSRSSDDTFHNISNKLFYRFQIKKAEESLLLENLGCYITVDTKLLPQGVIIPMQIFGPLTSSHHFYILLFQRRSGIQQLMSIKDCQFQLCIQSKCNYWLGPC